MGNRRRRNVSQPVPTPEDMSPSDASAHRQQPPPEQGPPVVQQPVLTVQDIDEADVGMVDSLPARKDLKQRILNPDLLSDEVDEAVSVEPKMTGSLQEPPAPEAGHAVEPNLPMASAASSSTTSLEQMIDDIIGEEIDEAVTSDDAVVIGEAPETFDDQVAPGTEEASDSSIAFPARPDEEVFPEPMEIRSDFSVTDDSVPAPADEEAVVFDEEELLFDDPTYAPPPDTQMPAPGMEHAVSTPGEELGEDQELWDRLEAVEPELSFDEEPPDLFSGEYKKEALPAVEGSDEEEQVSSSRKRKWQRRGSPTEADADEPVMLRPGELEEQAKERAMNLEEPEQPQGPGLYMATRRANLGGANHLPIDLPDSKDAIDEINHALAAFADLQYGQTGMIRWSLRQVPGFREEARGWLRARKSGNDPDAQKKGFLPSLIEHVKYALTYIFYSVNEVNSPGSMEKPLSPWQRGKDLTPLPASQVDPEEKQAWKEAEEKARDTAHYEAVMRVAAFGAEEHKDDLDMIVEEAAAGLEVFSTPHQQIIWEQGAPLDTALGLMGARQPEEIGMILSAVEMGTLAHVPDDITNPHGVKVNRSYFKQMPLSNPIVVDDPLEPQGGIIPIGIQNPRSEDRQVIGLNNSQLDQHLIVTGKTGSGKSEWMKWIVFGVAKADYPMVLIDPHGQLSDEIMNALIMNCPDRIDDIVYCDISDSEHPVALNPLDINSMEEVESTVHSVIEMLGSPKVNIDKGGAPRAMVYAREALTALCHANLALEDPNTKCTMLDVMTFFSNPEFRHLVVEFCQNELIRQKYDFDTGPFEQMGEKQQLEHVQPIIRAFSELGNSEAFSMVFSSPENKLDFARLISGNKLVIVKLARFAAGGQAELGSFVGALVLPWLLSSMASWGRTKDPITGVQSGRGCRVLVDEAPTLMGAGSSVPQVLAEARKWDLGLLMAAQFLDQFDNSIIDAALANTASKVTMVQDPNKAGPITKAIAGASSKVQPADIANLPNYHFYGNILLPSGAPGGLAASGPFTAACMPPINCNLDESALSSREQVIAQSQAQITNSRQAIVEQSRERVSKIMLSLRTQHQDRLTDDDYVPPPLFGDDRAAGEDFGWSG